MSIDRFPILRVEVDRVRYAMLQHLTDYEAGVSAVFEAQIKAQLTPENIERMVADSVRVELPGVIRCAIHGALSKLRWDAEIGGVLSDALGKALADMKRGAK